MIRDYESVDVFIGVDVGESDHHAVALNKSGKKLLDTACPMTKRNYGPFCAMNDRFRTAR